MAQRSVASLKARIDECIAKRAALEERKARAQQDLKAAEKALLELGLTPGKKAEQAVAEAEDALADAIERVEKQLGI